MNRIALSAWVRTLSTPTTILYPIVLPATPQMISKRIS